MRINKSTITLWSISAKPSAYYIKKLELTAINSNACHDKMAQCLRSFYHGIFSFSMLKKAKEVTLK